MKQSPSITLDDDRLLLAGDWTIHGIETLPKNPLQQIILPTYALKIDGSKISALDTAGICLIQKFKKQLSEANIETELTDFSSQQTNFIEIINNAIQQSQDKTAVIKTSFLETVGMLAVEKYQEFIRWMSFVGEFTIVSGKLLVKPWRIPWKSLVSTVDVAGLRALPIIAFLSFLIGVVLTYQIGLQLAQYGANIYIVGFLGLGIFREFGPLIAAIILAGRTSSSYTAQLGLMQANEEIDALKTMGIAPLELLIFPRIFGLIIAMPLLVVWSDIFGLLGGMLMSKATLGVSITAFIEEFPQDVTLTSFMIGMIKAPVFGMIIASVGCYHGLRVSGSATSIGNHTTKSVVLAIFLIIIADAVFSIAYSYLGI